MLDLGRYLLGQECPLPLVVKTASGQPAVPDAPPVASIYSGGTLLMAITLYPSDPKPPYSVYSSRLYLGNLFGSGKYLVVYRYQVGGVAGLAVAAFTVVGGGDAGGNVIALYSLDRPEARYVLGQLSGGSLVQGRDPHF